MEERKNTGWKITGKRTVYGQGIGILMLDTQFPRLPGDIGNATTFDYPVLYRIVEHATTQTVVLHGDEVAIEPFIREGKALIQQGARAIVTSCGFMAKFQREMASALDVPVYTSSLLQVPLIYAMLKPEQKVGILTANADILGEAHFAGVGISHIPKAVAGMEGTHFADVFVGNQAELDPVQAREDMRRAARRLVTEHPEVGAIVLECTNMPPFARTVQEETQLPVFDIVTLTNYVNQSLHRSDFCGYL